MAIATARALIAYLKPDTNPKSLVKDFADMQI